jgi:hypothetical protein
MIASKLSKTSSAKQAQQNKLSKTSSADVLRPRCQTALIADGVDCRRQ